MALTRLKRMAAGLMVLILAAASGMPVSAGETEESSYAQVQFIDSGFGSSSETIISGFSSLYLDAEGQSIEPSVTQKTLPDGSWAFEVLYSGAENGGFRSDIGYYFIDDKLVAVVGDRVPGSDDMEQLRSSLTKEYGAPFRLDTASLGSLSELIKEDAHIEEGQDAWTYAIPANAFLPAEASSQEFPAEEGKAIGTVSAEDGHLYISMFIDPSLLAANAANAAAADRQSTDGLEGADDLTPEEKQKVSQYMDYLQYKMKREAEEYIAYLKAQR